MNRYPAPGCAIGCGLCSGRSHLFDLTRTLLSSKLVAAQDRFPLPLQHHTGRGTHCMSASTQAMSAQIPAGLRALRGSVASSTDEAVSLYPSLRETLASFSLPPGTTTRQLYDLLQQLDHECLRHATDVALNPAQDSISEVESVAGLATFLSGSLSQCGYPGTSIFQEIQLRALISSLALLQHNGVHSLEPELYDKLRLKNISARFQKIAFHMGPSSILADRIRYAPMVYLVQLASQYVSFVDRGDSPWPSIFGPTVDVFFSALALVGMAPFFDKSMTDLDFLGRRSIQSYKEHYWRSQSTLQRMAKTADQIPSFVWFARVHPVGDQSLPRVCYRGRVW